MSVLTPQQGLVQHLRVLVNSMSQIVCQSQPSSTDRTGSVINLKLLNQLCAGRAYKMHLLPDLLRLGIG